jgi:outer membrane protein TolC
MQHKHFKSLLVALAMAVPGIALSQKVDYNTIILPETAKNISFEEKLVQLAWANNPTNEILNHQVRIAHLEVKQARWRWLNQFNASGNLNEFTIDPPATPNAAPLFYPRYNIGATITLGNFVTDPLNVKTMKEQKRVAELNVNSQKLTLRAEVLRRYYTYLASKEIWDVRREALEDANASKSLAEQRFKSGDTTIEDYNAALENLNGQKTQEILSESNYNIAKISVEELIGVRLEDVK